MKILRTLLALVAGILVGVIAVAIIEAASMFAHGLTPPSDMNDQVAMKGFIASLPATAFLAVAIAWCAGSFSAAALAKWMAPDRRHLAGALATIFFLAASLYNLIAIPSPIWMWVASLVGVPVFGAIGLCMVPSKPYLVSSTCQIAAPAEQVFEAIANPEQYAKVIPGIQKVEILGETHRGVGTRWRETRMMNGRQVMAVLDVTEYRQNERIRMAAEMCGTTWDTLFELQNISNNQSALTTTLQAIPQTFLSRLLTPMMMGMVRSGIESDVRSVKDFFSRRD